jgi:uncharacterized protein (TIGR02996 family)
MNIRSEFEQAILSDPDDDVHRLIYADWLLENDPAREAFMRRQGLLGPSVYNSIGMKLVPIPAGTFLMGSPEGEAGRSDNEGPQHEVEISKPFYMSVFPVTQGQWQQVMGNNPSWFSKTGGGNDEVKGMDTRDFPVETVSWNDADDFCRTLSELPAEKMAGRTYRLPTEAEWEYACRGGATTYQVFHFGNSLSSAQANFAVNYLYGGVDRSNWLNRTCKVGSYKANPIGLYDMHGNVQECCSDWYGEDYYKSSLRRDPLGPGSGSYRVIRGGSWINYSWFCRSAQRYDFEPAARNYYIGFRVAI